MDQVYSDCTRKKYIFLKISNFSQELEPQSHSKLGSGSRILACQGMGVGWEAHGCEFAWAYVALLTTGECILDLSHYPASAVLLGSWARLNGLSASMSLSTAIGFSLHFLSSVGDEPCMGRKGTPQSRHLTCSVLNYRHRLVNFGQVEPNCRIRMLMAIQHSGSQETHCRGHKKKAFRKVYSTTGNGTQL